MRIFVRMKLLARLARSGGAKAAFWLLWLTLPGEVQAQDFTYTNTNGTITITGYIGPGGDVVIPSTIAGAPVTSIGDGAFSFVSNMTGVTIPDSVTNLGEAAFTGCPNLAHISIGKGITTIKGGPYTQSWGTFQWCSSLTRVTIPNNQHPPRRLVLFQRSPLLPVPEELSGELPVGWRCEPYHRVRAFFRQRTAASLLLLQGFTITLIALRSSIARYIMVARINLGLLSTPGEGRHLFGITSKPCVAEGCRIRFIEEHQRDNEAKSTHHRRRNWRIDRRHRLAPGGFWGGGFRASG